MIFTTINLESLGYTAKYNGIGLKAMSSRKVLLLVLFSILGTLFVQTLQMAMVDAVVEGDGEDGGQQYKVFISPKSVMLGANVVVSGYVLPAESNTTVELTYISPLEAVIVRNVTSMFEGEFNDEFPASVAGCWQVQATWRYNATHTVTSEVKHFKVYEEESEIICSLSPISLTQGGMTTLTGRLNPPLSDIPIAIKYKIDCEWYHLATIETTVNGSFSYSWLPLEEGEYLLKAYWGGNDTYCGAYSKLLPLIVTSVVSNTTQNAPITETDNPVLSVQSNSTISQLVFNSENQLLSITVSGENGTMGHVKVVLAKALIPDPSKLQVYLDEESVSYNTESTDDSWILFVHYHHSTHTIAVSLSAPSLWTVNQLLVIFSGLVTAILFTFMYLKENSVVLVR